jgi:uncharacterized protein YaaQ
MLEQRLEVMTNSVQDVLQSSPQLRMEEIVIARREMLHAQRSALSNIRRSGALSDESYGELVSEIDLALEANQKTWVNDLRLAEENRQICQLIFVILQVRDLESATNVLAMRGVRVTHINSNGLFSRDRYALLLIGIPEGMLEDTIEALDRVCKARAALVSLPQVLDGSARGEKKRVDLHAATIFALNVERCEVI